MGKAPDEGGGPVAEHGCWVEHQLGPGPHHVLAGRILRPGIRRHEHATADPYELA